MIQHSYNDMTYFTYNIFDTFPQISCAVSTRLGGVSTGYLHTLNLSFRTGDNEQAVLENRSHFYDAMNVTRDFVVQAQLVHGAHIEVVTEQTPLGIDYKFAETDGLVTNMLNRPLFIPVADCTAIAFFDPQKQVIGLLHAGWKGIVRSIVPAMIATMNERFGSHPADILVGISPSLGPCCYEVRGDLVEAFTNVFPQDAHRFFIQQADDTIHLDMWSALRWQMLESGLQEEHIELPGLCTACRTDLFYSHRAEHGKTGRFASLLVLKA